MSTILQINISANRGSTGKIAEGIGRLVLAEGWESYIAYGGSHRSSASNLIRIGGKWNIYTHVLQSRLFDNHGLASRSVTKRFVEQLRAIKPDIIHLHNIHDYYLNYPLLFSYLMETGVPIVWTLHDCWPFTGHCAHFDHMGCEKWKTGCNHCEGLSLYPRSWFSDRSERNYRLKKQYFGSVVGNTTLVPVSEWIAKYAKQSFLADAKMKIIHNGIDMELFAPQPSKGLRERFGLGDRFVVLGVASPWTPTKGLKDFIRLHSMLPQEEYAIFVVGLSEKQLKELPEGVVGITRTDSPHELAAIYSMADVFLNPTYEDNFPTTNLEAMACGTPVLVYDTGGCKEAVTAETGSVLKQGDIEGAAKIITYMRQKNVKFKKDACRQHAEQYFDEKSAFREYIELYKQLLNS